MHPREIVYAADKARQLIDAQSEAARGALSLAVDQLVLNYQTIIRTRLNRADYTHYNQLMGTVHADMEEYVGTLRNPDAPFRGSCQRTAQEGGSREPRRE